ncbi:release factor [Tothia fuscella]|uniref:Release factor n=1 Tax=Tothia fuscella TaxID=1048955 RepID=A0A9P4P1S3_9PEZI|nr:release factor [Tothia fuscella]
MFKSPWVCSRCLIRTCRSGSRRTTRFHSSQSSTSSKAIYPALLTRARKIAAEYKTVSEQLLDDYDVNSAKKTGELAPVANALKRWEDANESRRELRALLDDPTTDSELRVLAAEDLDTSTQQLNEASQSLTKSLVPKNPSDDLPCLIEIRPGAGGGEATLFAEDLLGMYRAYCSERGLRTKILNLESVDSGGISEAILEVESPGAYGTLRCEAGVHRVQRVPATETKGRTHTSSAAVMVLPSFPSSQPDESLRIDVNDPNSDFFIDPKEVRLDVMRASGAGGQHVNKTESAVRLTHIPTSTVVAIQESRSQIANREKAWQVLRSRLAQVRKEAREEEMLKLRRSVVGVARIGRGDKIRTYNWGQQRITDHRSGMTVHGIEGILAGGANLEKLMVSVREWMVEREVEDMIVAAESA